MDYQFYKQVKLVPEITDEQIEEMLQLMRPVVYRDKDSPLGEGLHLVDIGGVDRRHVAYSWDPKILRKARLAWGNGMDATILSFHKYGVPFLFKPSLAEVLASIRHYVPDGWQHVKFFWIDSRFMDRQNQLEGVHFARCHLFTSEFPE